MTSRKGWYVVTVADAARELIVPMDEDEEKNPRLTAIEWTPDGTAIYASWVHARPLGARRRPDRPGGQERDAAAPRRERVWRPAFLTRRQHVRLHDYLKKEKKSGT